MQQRILGYENGIKVWRNRLSSLADQEQMARKVEAEQALRAAVAEDAELAAAYAGAWDDVERALAAWQTMADDYRYVEGGKGFQGSLFSWAKTLVRGTNELQKPNEERLRAYRETALPRVEQRLFAATPVDPGFETLLLSFSLDKLREALGPDDPVVKQVLGTESPRALAGRLVADTRLADPAYREELWQGGPEAVAASDDPMIALARSVARWKRTLILLAGPVTNIASLTVLTGVLGKRATSIYLTSIAVCAVLFGLIVDRVYAYLGISAQAVVGQASEIVPHWAGVIGAIAILAMSIKPVWSAVRERFKLKGTPKETLAEPEETPAEPMQMVTDCCPSCDCSSDSRRS